MVHEGLSFVIILISIFSIYSSFFLLKSACGSLSVPYASGLFMYKYIFFIYIGSILLNVLFFPSTSEFYTRPDLILNIWIYTTASLFIMPVGMLFTNIVFHHKPYKLVNRLNSTKIILGEGGYSALFIVTLIIFIICFSILLLYISKLNYLPIEGVFNGFSARELAVFRSDSGSNFTGKYYRYAFFMKTVPFLFLLLAFFLKNKSTKWKMFFYTLLVYNIFVSIMDLQKAPVIQLFLSLLMLNFYIKGRIDKRTLVFTGVFLIFLIILMYVFFMGLGERSFSVIIRGILDRIFLGQIKGFYYWQLFQEANGYLYGASFPNPGGIFPFEYRKITVEVMDFAHPELAEFGIVGSMPTAYFADWFINFGWLMALFSMFLLGMILQLIDIIFIRKLNKNKNIIKSVLYLYLCIYMSSYVLGSYVGLIVDIKLFVSILLLLFLTLFEPRKNVRY